MVRALQADIGHFTTVFTSETSGAEIAITEAVTTGRQPQGPLVPLLGPLPSGQSLPPSSRSTRKAKKHMYEDCGKEFSKLSDMKDHKRNKHPSEGDELKPYCATCKKSFSSKSNLKMHMNSKHKKQFIHNCEICGYGTNNKQSKISHQIRGSSEN